MVIDVTHRSHQLNRNLDQAKRHQCTDRNECEPRRECWIDEKETHQGQSRQNQDRLELRRTKTGQRELAHQFRFDVGEDGNRKETDHGDESEFDAAGGDTDANEPVREREWIGEMIEQLTSISTLSRGSRMGAVDAVSRVVANHADRGQQTAPPEACGEAKAHRAKDCKGVSEQDNSLRRKPLRNVEMWVQRFEPRSDQGIQKAVGNSLRHLGDLASCWCVFLDTFKVPIAASLLREIQARVRAGWKRGQAPIVRSTLRAACGYWGLTPFPAGEAPSGPLAAIGAGDWGLTPFPARRVDSK